jgi:hypothetical protein
MGGGYDAWHWCVVAFIICNEAFCSIQRRVITFGSGACMSRNTHAFLLQSSISVPVPSWPELVNKRCDLV